MNVNYVYERNGQPPEGIGLTPNHGTQIKHRRYSDWLAMICPELRKAKKKRENLNRKWAYGSLAIPEQGKNKRRFGDICTKETAASSRDFFRYASAYGVTRSCVIIKLGKK